MAGGLAGANVGVIAESFATGTVSIPDTNTPSASGGLVGFNDGLIKNCYAEGAATVSNNSFVGGLVGQTSGTIADSYSTGAPSGASRTSVGGFLGYDNQAGGENISDDYWDTTTSGITNLSQGAGNIANDPGITGETTTQLQSGLPAGFDPSIWVEDANINGGLPYLIANPPQQ